MKITVCIGSACHIKGSRQVVERLQYLIEKENLGDKIELSGTFCTGNCEKGICVLVDGKLHTVNPENVQQFFDEEVLKRKTLL